MATRSVEQEEETQAKYATPQVRFSWPHYSSFVVEEAVSQSSGFSLARDLASGKRGKYIVQRYRALEYLGAPLGAREPVLSDPLPLLGCEGHHQALIAEQLMPALAVKQLAGMQIDPRPSRKPCYGRY